MNSSVIMQWDNVHKSILILLLGGTYSIFWVLWLLLSYSISAFQHWINPHFFSLYLSIFVASSIFYFSLTYVAYRFQKHSLMQRYMPYVAVIYLGCSMLWAGFGIGIGSPATIVGYINLVTVGLVLLDRKIIYPVFLPITVLLLALIYWCGNGDLLYAPIFSDELNQLVLYKNEYWVYSMIILYAPIFVVGLGLFEVLLIQWRNREKLIDEISRQDPLTAIDNRRSIGQTLDHLELYKIPYAVVILDLDFFKTINDDYGHETGDLVLIEVAKILKNHIQTAELQAQSSISNPLQQGMDQSNSTTDILNHLKLKSKSKIQNLQVLQIQKDTVGRYGGEEFIIIYVNKSLEYVLKNTELLRKHIEQAPITSADGRIFSFTASFGVAFSQVGVSKEDSIRMADQALYRAKDRGRNQVFCYNSDIEHFHQEA